LVGSKAGEGSGVWLPHFIRILAARHKELRIEAWDLGEIESEMRDVLQGCDVTLVRRSKLYKGDGSEYTAVVDDSYITGHGIERVSWKCRHWSRKVQDDQGMLSNLWNNCFHDAEARQFSSSKDMQEPRYTACCCSLCLVADYLSEDEDEYKVIRSIFALFGAEECEPLSSTIDASVYGKFYRAITHGEVVLDATEAEKRVVKAISTVVPLVTVEQGVVMDTSMESRRKRLELYPLDLESAEPMYGSKSYPYFEGKVVSFIGVNPLILGHTRTMKSVSTAKNIAHITFISDPIMATMCVNVDEIWCQSDLDPIYGRALSGESHQGFGCYKYKTVLPYLLPVREKDIKSKFILIDERPYTSCIQDESVPLIKLVSSRSELTVYDVQVSVDYRVKVDGCVKTSYGDKVKAVGKDTRGGGRGGVMGSHVKANSQHRADDEDVYCEVLSPVPMGRSKTIFEIDAIVGVEVERAFL